MGRGLPKLYKWDDRSIWKVKDSFSDPVIIEQRIEEKKTLRAFQKKELPDGSQMALLTWVMADGWGDYYTQLETAKILKSAFDTLKLIMITFVHKDRILPEQETYPTAHRYVFRYTGSSRQHIIYEELSEEVYDLLLKVPLILQIPTFFPHTESLLAKIGKGPRHELMGEYGFIDSAWFHPKTSAHCMGLHFLEKGILTKEIPPKDVRRNFNLDYTKTLKGNYMFLHILLKALEDNDQDITIATVSLQLYLEKWETGLKDLLIRFGIGKIIFHFKNFICPQTISDQQKTLVIQHIDHLNQEKFLEMVAQTDQLVGCTGDGSITDAISTGKPFFYDPPSHKRNFLKDLIALAETSLPHYPETVSFLKLSLKNSHLILEDVMDGWVTEEFLLIEEEKTSPEDTRDEALAEQMGELLKKPKTREGFSVLCKIIRTQYSVNEILCAITARSFDERASG